MTSTTAAPEIEYQIRESSGELHFFHNGIVEPYIAFCQAFDFDGESWKLSWTSKDGRPHRFRLLTKEGLNEWNIASQKRITELNSVFALSKDSDWFFVDQQVFPVNVVDDKWTKRNKFSTEPSKDSYILEKGKKMPAYDLCDEYMADCIAEVLTQEQFETKYVR